MSYITRIVTLLLLSQVVPLDSQQSLNPLNKLIETIRKDQDIWLIFMLQHHEAQNCETDNWNPDGFPILRFNDRSEINLRRNFNHFYVVAVICITKDSELMLLNNLAIAFQRMRQERIILWLQEEATPDLFETICKLAELHGFIDITLIEAGGLNNSTGNIFHLQPFPAPYFVSGIKSNKPLNYRGKVAIALPDPVYRVFSNTSKFYPRYVHNYMSTIEFASRYNLSLKIKKQQILGSRKFDIKIPHPIRADSIRLESVRPYSFTEIIILVPCAKEHSVQDVFQQMRFWVLVILVVYLMIVAVGSLMLCATNRFLGRSLRLRIPRSLAAILGLRYTPSQRWNLALRQLFLAFNIFGFLLSKFLTCHLSALLTQHPHHGQVTTIKELRDSGLPVSVDRRLRIFIKDHVCHEFFDKLVTNPMSLNPGDRLKRLFSFNDYYAHITTRDIWSLINEYQKRRGWEVFCSSEKLRFISSELEGPLIPNNSIFQKPFIRLEHRIFEAGIQKHWTILQANLIEKINKLPRKPTWKHKVVPLSLEHFKSLWCIIIFGYALSLFAFIVELLWKCIRL
ncbi:hypothetical protein KR018_003125 [Drosophila ironensis]|nr:hypothetical protein KR018_003125 [Drosophila ironensis]